MPVLIPSHRPSTSQRSAPATIRALFENRWTSLEWNPPSSNQPANTRPLVAPRSQATTGGEVPRIWRASALVLLSSLAVVTKRLSEVYPATTEYGNEGCIP